MSARLRRRPSQSGSVRDLPGTETLTSKVSVEIRTELKSRCPLSERDEVLDRSLISGLKFNPKQSLRRLYSELTFFFVQETPLRV